MFYLLPCLTAMFNRILDCCIGPGIFHGVFGGLFNCCIWCCIWLCMLIPRFIPRIWWRVWLLWYCDWSVYLRHPPVWDNGGEGRYVHTPSVQVSGVGLNTPLKYPYTHLYPLTTPLSRGITGGCYPWQPLGGTWTGAVCDKGAGSRGIVSPNRCVVCDNKTPTSPWIVSMCLIHL